MPKLLKYAPSRKMVKDNTPIEDYREQYGLWVKREDLSCPPPGPPFSKARGVFSWVAKQREKIIGVLDTRHSQGGWAVARACQILGKKALVFYPEFKYEPGPREPQLKAKALGATLIGLPAGRSAILYHAAKKQTFARGGEMIPNALKLMESVVETAREVPSRHFDNVIIPASSGTLAAGVIQGFCRKGLKIKRFIIHLGYSRSHEEVLRYLQQMSGIKEFPLEIIDEGYAYKDEATPGETPPWPCNEFYDLKAFRWWLANRASYQGSALLWNIG